MDDITIESSGRYGDFATATGLDAVRELIAKRIDELGDEQFPRPDYEHEQISVIRPDGWLVTVFMRGLIALERFDGKEPQRHLWGLPTAELSEMLLQFARGDLAGVLARPWAAEQSELTGRDDYYLLLSRPDLTDLHRAVAKGDATWVAAELAGGADIHARDRFGATPLHRASLAGRRSICEQLLAAGADPAAVDENGEAVWEYANGADDYLTKSDTAELVALLKSAAGVS